MAVARPDVHDDDVFNEVLLPQLRESASDFLQRWNAANTPEERLDVLHEHVAAAEVVFALIGDDAHIIRGGPLLQIGVTARIAMRLKVAAVPCDDADHAEAVRQMLAEKKRRCPTLAAFTETVLPAILGSLALSGATSNHVEWTSVIQAQLDTAECVHAVWREGNVIHVATLKGGDAVFKVEMSADEAVKCIGPVDPRVCAVPCRGVDQAENMRYIIDTGDYSADDLLFRSNWTR